MYPLHFGRVKVPHAKDERGKRPHHIQLLYRRDIERMDCLRQARSASHTTPQGPQEGREIKSTGAVKQAD
ncbi:hypothetical protein JZ751_021105 [Albula glossodonta]|uniref:Uncharacterized protein n=1 Tax=Albula glossodonta TaxID=121402 RepID=A0A8T2PM26_9TELE|nr:hypothetical protein JZ751_021105 [Albula glossodonta]